jgi:hypothetical protein
MTSLIVNNNVNIVPYPEPVIKTTSLPNIHFKKMSSFDEKVGLTYTIDNSLIDGDNTVNVINLDEEDKIESPIVDFNNCKIYFEVTKTLTWREDDDFGYMNIYCGQLDSGMYFISFVDCYRSECTCDCIGECQFSGRIYSTLYAFNHISDKNSCLVYLSTDLNKLVNKFEETTVCHNIVYKCVQYTRTIRNLLEKYICIYVVDGILSYLDQKDILTLALYK